MTASNSAADHYEGLRAFLSGLPLDQYNVELPFSQVEQLIADIGLRPVWVGGPEYTPTVDAIASLWFALALKQGRGRHLAFKLLTDES